MAEVVRYVQSGRMPLEDVNLNKLHAISTAPCKPPAPKGFELGAFETGDEVSSRFRKLEELVAKLSTQVSEQEKMNEKMKNDHEKLKNDHEKMKNDHEKTKNDHEKTKNQVIEQGKLITGLQANDQKLFESSKTAHLRSLGLDTSNKCLKSSIAELQRENSSLKSNLKQQAEKVAKLEVANSKISLKLRLGGLKLGR